jgi:putative YhdH/YhfP family quinone oxidoreductase
VQTIPLGDLSGDGVLIRARWSSVNYKDALAATGHAGVVRRFPHIPGVDVAGEVVEVGNTIGEPGFALAPGSPVLVTGYELGAGAWGGWCQYVRVPRGWVVPCPATLSLRDAMILGTAGFTAALSVDALVAHGVTPGDGEVVVTGATGGVGCLAVGLLAKLGFQTVAVTGKPDCHARLRQWGARDVIGREAVVDASGKPLLPARWAGAVDTVGGATLSTIVRQTLKRGCVTACGLVGGTDLALTVYPFILRGVTLAGIDSAWCPLERRGALEPAGHGLALGLPGGPRHRNKSGRSRPLCAPHPGGRSPRPNAGPDSVTRGPVRV